MIAFISKLGPIKKSYLTQINAISKPFNRNQQILKYVD